MNGIVDNEKSVVHEDENIESTTARRKRIQVEKTEITSDLSNLIIEFLASSHFSDKRKFPKTQLAKIVIQYLVL